MQFVSRTGIQEQGEEMRRINLNKSNVSKINNKSGIYKIYDKKGKMVYVGTSKIMRHRLQSYYQKDDYSINRTKRALRPDAKQFTYSYMKIAQARKNEKRIKKNLRHNHL